MINSPEDEAKEDLPQTFLVPLSRAELMLLVNGANYAVLDVLATNKHIEEPESTALLRALSRLSVSAAMNQLGPDAWDVMLFRLAELLGSKATGVAGVEFIFHPQSEATERPPEHLALLMKELMDRLFKVQQKEKREEKP